MKSFDIMAAIIDVIEAADILPIVSENGGTGTRPYIDFQQATARRTVIPLRGGPADREIGSYAATVVVDEATYTRAAKDKAHEIVELFPVGRRIEFEGGVVTIGADNREPATARPGFNADAEYRVPVIIPYVATSTI